MKKILLILLSLFIISCEKEDNDINSEQVINISISVNEISINNSSFQLYVDNIPSSSYEIGLAWSTSTNPTISNSTVSVVGESFPVIGYINDLESETVYYVRSYIQLESEIYYSNEIEFTTKTLNLICDTSYKYDDLYDERSLYVLNTIDDGVVVGGYKNTYYGFDQLDLVISKFNSNCEKTWEIILPNLFEIYNITEDLSGNLLIVSKGHGTGTNYPMIYKIDSAGNIIWFRSYVKGVYSALKDVVLDKDGNYNLVGTYAFDADERFGWFLKIDTNGDIQLEKSFPKEDMMIGGSIAQINDNGFYVVGDLQYESTLLYKLDNSANIIWRKNIGVESSDLNNSLLITSDNNILISGLTYRIGPRSDAYNMWLVKLNLDGDIIWESGFGDEDYEFGGSPEINSNLVEDSNGYIYITKGAGFAPGNSGTLYHKIWLFKIDPNNGNQIWAEDFGSNEYYTMDLSFSMALTGSNELLIVGQKEDEEPATISGTGDFWFLKLQEE